MTAKKREFVLMCVGLVFGLLIVAGFIVFLLQSQKGDSAGDGLEAIIRERQKELIAQGKVDEAFELENKLKGASTLPSESREKEETSQVTPAIVAEKVEITDRESPTVATKGDKEADPDEKKSSNGSEKSIKISLGGEEVEPSPTISLSGVPSVKQAQATNNLSAESQDYDTDLKIDELESAAALGDERSLAILSICYREGYGVKVDQKRAFAYAERAVTAGDVLGNYAMALCYSESVGTEFNGSEMSRHAALALEKFELEAKSGDPWVEFAAADLFTGRLGTPEDFTSAFSCYESAAKKEFAPAKAGLAYMLEMGKGCTQDIERASALYLEASNAGWTEAQVDLANRKLASASDEDDRKEAFELVSKAALSGSPFALGLEGVYYLEGLGTEKNEDLAIQKLVESSELGFGEASFQLGMIFFNGEGSIAADPARSKQFFSQGQKVGHRGCIVGLGLVAIFKNDGNPTGTPVTPQVMVEACKTASGHWSKLPPSYWGGEVQDDVPLWVEMEPAITEVFSGLGLPVPWKGVVPELAAKGMTDTKNGKGTPIGPKIMGIQIGENIEMVAETFNRDHLQTVGGEKLRAVKTPVGGVYVCSTEEGIELMLERDKALAGEGATLEQMFRSAAYSAVPVIFGDENGLVVKFVFTRFYIERAFPNQYSQSNRQFLSFLESKFDLPFMESELVETRTFGKEGLSNRFFGFTDDGVSVEIEADKGIIVRLSE